MKNHFIEDEQPESNSLIYRNDDSNNQPDFYQQIYNMNNQDNGNGRVDNNIRQLEAQILKNEEQHKQHMIHLETVGMMSKYQLVFTKMEASIYRIAGFLKIKESQLKFNGFHEIRKKAQQEVLDLALKSKTYTRVFQKKATKLFNVLQDRTQTNISKGFRQILVMSQFKILEIRHKDEQDRQNKECVQKLTKKDQDIDKIKRKNEEFDSQFWQLKQRETDLSQKLLIKQRMYQKLEQEIMEMKRQPGSTTNKQLNNNNNVDVKLKELENNNAILGLQITQSQTCLSTFVREMNELLDSHCSFQELSEENHIIEQPKRKYDVNSFRGLTNGGKV